jgi:hypothetical protein
MSISHAASVLIGPRQPAVPPATRRKARIVICALVSVSFALGACVTRLMSMRGAHMDMKRSGDASCFVAALGENRWTPADRAGAAVSQEADVSLRHLLRAVAPGGEVLVTLSTRELVQSGALGAWVDDVRSAGVSSFVVFALDDETHAAMGARDVPVWRAPSVQTADAAISNHGVSARKYALLRQVVALGYSPFLLDTDVAVFKNPLEYLHRDADVETMSDGWDDARAYGELVGDDDAAMGWARYSQAWRVWALNSGCFYLRAGPRALTLLDDIATHLQHQKDWDQSVFTRHVMAPLGGPWPAHGLVVRILDRRTFQNSKTLFTAERKLPLEQQAVPVLVHVNYHADKDVRLAAVRRRWRPGGGQGDAHALDALTDAS